MKIGKYDGISWNYGLTTDLEITDQIWQKWHTEASFEGEVTLSVSLDHTAVQQLFLQRLKKPDLSEWPSKMLTHGFLSDMIILAGGETDTANGIKCHKFVLSGKIAINQKTESWLTAKFDIFVYRSKSSLQDHVHHRHVREQR